MNGILKSGRWLCVCFYKKNYSFSIKRTELILLLESSWSQYLFFETAASLGPFTPFSKTDTINIPDAIYDQFNRMFVNNMITLRILTRFV